MPAAAGKLSNGRAFKSRRSEVGGWRTADENAEKAEVGMKNEETKLCLLRAL